MRRRISTGTAFTALGLVLLMTAQAAAAVSWGAVKSASAPHGFNTGRALATTKQGSTSYVHQVYVNNYPGGHPAGDNPGNPREAVMYQRRSASGSALGAAVRVNKSTQHGNGSSIAASGSHVYVVWSHLSKYFYVAGDARTLQFRSNAHNGSGSWSAIKSLTTSGEIDDPSVAASGTYVYVAYTNALTGSPKLLISSDYGAHFHDSGLSMASITTSNCTTYCGYPSVAAAGSNVGMAWLSGDTFTASAWTSTNHAVSKTDFTLSSGDVVGSPRVAALGSRIAFAVPTCGGGCATAAIKAKVWNNGTLGPDRTAAAYTTATTYKRSYSVDVGLVGTAGLGLAWNACRLGGCSWSDGPAKGSDVVWRESTNNGVSWKNPFTLQTSTGTGATGKARRINAYPSIVFLSSSKRVVVFDAYNGPFNKGSVLLRAGSGTP